MSFLASLKHFFGFDTATVQAPSVSPAGEFSRKLAALPEDQKVAFVDSAWKQAETEATALLQTVRGQAGHAADFFAKAREHYALEVAISTEVHKQLGVGEKFVAAHEQVLGRLPLYAEAYAAPAEEILAKLDAYIQQQEEVIYFSEARGEYKLSVSENGRWIKFPFADPALLKPARIPQAQKQLNELFVQCPELALLEMEARVPWHPISFIEITAIAKSARMVLLSSPETHGYFAYIYR